jgi:hypothetical protein
VPVDDATACGDKTGRVVTERSQGLRRLLDEERLVGARRPRYVPEPLDRVHRATVPPRVTG